MGFKVGDKVRCIATGILTLQLNEVYVVQDVYIYTEDMIKVDGCYYSVNHFELVKENTQFKVGDIVSWGGCEGVVIDNPRDESVCVRFGGHTIEYFHSDGKFRKWHKEPSLVLVSRSKKKVLKRYWRWDCKRIADGAICCPEQYLDEKGNSTSGRHYVDVEFLLKKHENEFVDIEVEDEN